MIIIGSDEEVWNMSEQLEKFHVVLLVSLLIGQMSGVFNGVVQEISDLLISLMGGKSAEVAPIYFRLPLQFIHDFLTAIALTTIIYSIYLVYEGNLSKSIFLKLIGYEVGFSIILFYTMAFIAMFVILLVMIMLSKLPIELANNIPTSGNFTIFMFTPSSLLVSYIYYKSLKKFEGKISSMIHSKRGRGETFLNGINLKTRFYFIGYPFVLLFIPFLISREVCSKSITDLNTLLTLESTIIYATAFTGLAELLISLLIILPAFHSLMNDIARFKTLKDRIMIYAIILPLILFLNPYFLPVIFIPLYCRILEMNTLNIQLLYSGILSMLVYLLFIVLYHKMISTVNRNLLI